MDDAMKLTIWELAKVFLQTSFALASTAGMTEKEIDAFYEEQKAEKARRPASKLPEPGGE